MDPHVARAGLSYARSLHSTCVDTENMEWIERAKRDPLWWRLPDQKPLRERLRADK
jgi:hypothetical protein